MKTWNIIGNRRFGYILSLLVLAPGIIALFLWGLNLGIDFTGGTVLDVRLGRAGSVEEVRQVLATFDRADAVIQASPDRPRQILIRTDPMDEAQTARLMAALKDRFGGVELLLAERVGPKIGRELRNQAILAVSLGLFLQVVYIAWRFRSFRYAITADIALLHDLLAVVGLFALTRRQVDSSFVAVLLTVVGYSINDKVVVFDRIREVLGLRIRATFPELVNRSILEVLTRSLTTGAGAIMAILAIFFLGGVTIRDFAFGLAVGVITGTYSSISVASALLVDWHLLAERRARRIGRGPAATAPPTPETVSAPVVAGNRAARRRNRR